MEGSEFSDTEEGGIMKAQGKKSAIPWCAVVKELKEETTRIRVGTLGWPPHSHQQMEGGYTATNWKISAHRKMFFQSKNLLTKT